MPLKNDHSFDLVLASSSSYRAAQLRTAGLVFESCPPEVDESVNEQESAHALASRLAHAKCQKIIPQKPGCIIVAGDQVGEVNGVILGKPGTQAAAVEQLLACQGEEALFHSACAVAASESGKIDTQVVTTRLKFLRHSEAFLARYVAKDNPIDCAGGFKIENGGIALFEYVRADDPSALIGLPMITLFRQLRTVGYESFA